MSDLFAALSALKRMARLLDVIQLAAPNRYERVTNDYQAALEDVYQTWARALLKQLDGAKDDATRKQIISASRADLIQQLQQVGTEHLPYAVTAIGTTDYVPSPAAWRMIADAIDAQNIEFEQRLAPYVIDQFQRGVDEQLVLRDVANSLINRVDFYAGNQWATIQKLVGDFAAQAATRDDLVYRCRWVRVDDDHSCQSCIEFAKEYDSYDAMLAATGECVPGYFVGSPYKSCWLNCRCHIELFIDGKWTRI